MLLVEDQTLIALDTEAMLLELGAAKVEAVTSAQAALAWLATAVPGVGVLDINLGAAFSFGVAEELSRRKIPFIFTTGYGDDLLLRRRLHDVRDRQKALHACEALRDSFDCARIASALIRPA